MLYDQRTATRAGAMPYPQHSPTAWRQSSWRVAHAVWRCQRTATHAMHPQHSPTGWRQSSWRRGSPPPRRRPPQSKQRTPLAACPSAQAGGERVIRAVGVRGCAFATGPRAPPAACPSAGWSVASLVSWSGGAWRLQCHTKCISGLLPCCLMPGHAHAMPMPCPCCVAVQTLSAMLPPMP